MNVLYWGRIRGRSPVEEDLIHYLSQDHHGFQRFVQVMSLVETGDFYSLRKAEFKDLCGWAPGDGFSL